MRDTNSAKLISSHFDLAEGNRREGDRTDVSTANSTLHREV